MVCRTVAKGIAGIAFFRVAWLDIPLHWIWFVSLFLFHKPSTSCVWFGFLSFLILHHLRPLVLLPPSGLMVLPTWILLARALAPAERQVLLLMCQLQPQDLKVQAKERMVKFLVIITMNIKQRWGIKVCTPLNLLYRYSAKCPPNFGCYPSAARGGKMLCQRES